MTDPVMFADVLVPFPLEETFTYRVPAGTILNPGRRVKVDFRGRETTAFPVRIHGDSPEGFAVKDIAGIIDGEAVYDERTLDLARFVSSTYLSSQGEAMAMAMPRWHRPSGRYRIPFDEEGGGRVELTEGQERISRDIMDRHEKGDLCHLLFGVTGSGKTEIYMEMARHFTALGKSVIFMVPEISLSSQIFRRLWKVFGDRLMIYHSQLTPAQRLHNWIRFFRGDVKIAVGTRSSVFLQCPSLGAVIIDEEHDGSYKENSTPRYNARRVALYRCRGEGALLLLGSATPSVETLYAAERGVMGLHVFDRRYGDSVLPRVDVVRIGSRRDILSPALKLHTKKAVDRGFQAIFLLNRRGYSPFVVCESCGEVMQCPDCSISLNFHKPGDLLCHYCGHRETVPEKCRKCGSPDITMVGSGTQRAEDMIMKEYRGYRIFRLDQDSARKKDTAYEMIDRMKRGEVDILLGTQMVAKGFDFPRVTVVGVLMADIGLNIPDFRASERIFSLLVQVAGRCGRGSEPGRVIVQTLNDDQEIFGFIRNHDYYGFYRWELSKRKALGYPPFTRMIRLLVRGHDEARVVESIARLKEEVLAAVSRGGGDITVLGPSSAPLAKIGKNYRHHMVLKSRDAGAMKAAVMESRKVLVNRRVYLEIDVDPAEML